MRKIDAAVDFDFIYGEVEGLYGVNGNESVPPSVILRLMVLLVFYNVRSERELMATLPERLDWLWFLGFDLDSAIPNHSVLSKARARWGDEPFRVFFERTIASCVEAGLVNGRKMFCDSSLVQADGHGNRETKRSWFISPIGGSIRRGPMPVARASLRARRAGPGGAERLRARSGGMLRGRSGRRSSCRR